MAMDLSLLDQELCDEYLRNERALAAHESALALSLKGYISRKRINGRERHYLQWREGDRIKSTYIPDSELEAIERRVSERKSHESSIRRIRKDMEKIARVVGGDMIEMYRSDMER